MENASSDGVSSGRSAFSSSSSVSGSAADEAEAFGLRTSNSVTFFFSFCESSLVCGTGGGSGLGGTYCVVVEYGDWMLASSES